jgi:hypothetical protein
VASPTQGVLYTSDPLPASGSGTAEWRTAPSYATYVRAELRHETAAGLVPGAPAVFTDPGYFLGAVGGAWPTRPVSSVRSSSAAAVR